PVLLATLGGHRDPRTRDGERFWRAFARRVVRGRVPVLAVTTALMVGLAAPALGLHLVPGSFAGIPSSSESGRGVERGAGGGGPGGGGGCGLRAGGGRRGAAPPPSAGAAAGPRGAPPPPAVPPAVPRLSDGLFHDPEVLVVASGRRPPYVDPSGRFARVVV